MLSRHGTTQLPRKYTNHLQPKANRALCYTCAANAFGPATYMGLVTAVKDHSDTLTRTYNVPSKCLYQSTLDGCPWCTALANALVSSAELDYWYHDWQGSNTDGESLLDEDGEDNDDEPEVGDETNHDEKDGEPSGSEDDKSVSRDSSHGSVEPLTGMAGSLFELENLDIDADVKVEMTFQATHTHASRRFNYLKVRLELTASTPCHPDCPIPDLTGDRAVDLSFEIVSASLGSKLFPSDWGNVSPTSPTWTALANTWMSTCISNHPACKPPTSLQPTRLIDVTDPSNARLIVTNPAQPLQYAALSYVWGCNQTYVLTKATLQDKQQTLDMPLLPQTIKDAITVTRQLQLGYLWVDALCIIQDSQADKDKELPLMGAIYRNSAVTIIAASANSSTEGFLRPSQPPKFFIPPFDIPLGGQDQNSGLPQETLRLAYREYYLPTSDPTNTRAWCLQERVLSTRILSFSYDGLKWMCGEEHINPSAADEAPRPFYVLSADGPAGSLNTTANNNDTKNASDLDIILLRERWYRIRNDYSSRKLTYAGDKLLAISAVAAEVAGRTGWAYLAGMWREHLFEELHWKCEKERGYVPVVYDPDDPSSSSSQQPDPSKKSEYIAPSWAWPSIVSAPVIDDDMQERQPFRLRILRCEIEPEIPDFEFGKVKSGFLEVSGVAVDIEWELHEREYGDDVDVWLVDHSSGQRYIVGEGVLDYRDVPVAKGKMKCLALSTTKVGARKGTLVDGMMIQPHGHDGSFHRVGQFQMYGTTVFEGVKEDVYRIV
ncbi:hypothetical protein VTJ04DRAFT_10870 [Mycothermus thermophilus]|uniref:uncharacterized protein n=1 Tax=Humicola insolens TaxID=85995 RepID=UPI003742AB5F